jgi:hypothetical protein
MIEVHHGIYIKYSLFSATEHFKKYGATSSIIATVETILLFLRCISCHCTAQFLALSLIKQVTIEHRKEDILMRIDDVQSWKDYRGKKELLKHLSGETLTPKQAVIANCYQCNAGYVDGRVDCETTTCPLYGHMPYRKNKVTTKQARSEKQKEAIVKLAKSRRELTKKMLL